ncbi:unnamed protein product, partial [Strongylus vulgaris]
EGGEEPQASKDSPKGRNGERTVWGPAISSNIRVLTSRPRPTLRNIFTMGKEKHIDGKVRPSTASESRTCASFVPPPLERLDTVPIIRSIEIMPGIPCEGKSGNKMMDEKVANTETNDDPYLDERDTAECSDGDSDIDVTDILENSHKSITV